MNRGAWALLIASIFSLGPSEIQSAEAILGQCHMDHCSWFQVLETEFVKSNDIGTLIRTKLLSGDSRHPDGQYQNKSPIKWDKPKDEYTFCSKTRPAVLFHSLPEQRGLCRYGCWIAHTLAPGYSEGVFGYNTSDYVQYFRVCHALTNVDPGDLALARKFGYQASLIRGVDQKQMSSPEDMFRR